jgi:23S rRNA (uracil1939-C5)-methyltransferase
VSKKKKQQILENLQITDYAAEGKALAKYEGKVIFIAGVVPGDVVNAVVTKSKKDWAEARVLEVTQASKDRLAPFCKHFGLCGGCKWQMLPYHLQLQAKQTEVQQNIQRIGKLENITFLPIVGSANTQFYRNKLEFTCSSKRYLLTEEINSPQALTHTQAIGYHVPRIFDKAIDITECFLMDDINNQIRNAIRQIAQQHNFAFYDAKAHTGWLRNVMVRHCTTGQTMVNVVFNYQDAENQNLVLNALLTAVPTITTLLYTINPKFNDAIYDLTPVVYHGPGYVIEKLEEFSFKISAKSFFQTNTKQAEQLYTITRNFAGLTGQEVLYDLYCGTGSIGIFCSKGAKKIIGVEVVEDAITDAKENAALNNLQNASFFAGDVIKICNDAFFATHGRPDVVITDPPRAGMHEKLIDKLLEIAAPKIVYVSCNTATQARDLALLAQKYTVQKIQPVDMFPHTHHIESVALLTLNT